MEEKRLEFLDDERHEQYMREIFEAEERTDHKGILPAKDRIRQYKTKNIRRNIPSAFPNASQQTTRLKSSMIKSTQEFKGMPPQGAKDDKIRPVTAAASNFGMSEAPTAFTAGQNSSSANLGLKNRAISLSRFSKFEETEKAA